MADDPKLDARTFAIVMDKVTALVRAQTGNETHTQAMTLSTALFRVLTLLSTKYPSVYKAIQAETIPYVQMNQQWAIAIHQHMVQLEKEKSDADNQGVDGVDPKMGETPHQS